ncbi:uncharacterized protein LOC108157722 [Drosophila miranda]|uniref:uncharacterized protein LOC108157722 n=1 Tax=Drosophila miranda TaxID=7229 RepID=UPI0007E5CDCA|nr:uncharacterized protein LOC108157722 [Drosophila miranda]
MQDPRKNDLKKLTNAISFLQKRKDYHKRELVFEEHQLKMILAVQDAAHKKIKQMAKMQELQWLLSQDHHELNKVIETLKTFVDMNEDMKDTGFYKAATKYIDEHCNESEPKAPELPQ